MNSNLTLTNKMLHLLLKISQKIGRLEAEHERQLHLREDSLIRAVYANLAMEHDVNMALVQAGYKNAELANTGLASTGLATDTNNNAELEQLIKNCILAYGRISTLDPYRLDDFLALHKMLVKSLGNSLNSPLNTPLDSSVENKAGQFRAKNIIRVNTLNSADNENDNSNMVQVGADSQQIAERMQQLFSWLKTDDSPVLIKAILLHQQINEIQPFAKSAKVAGMNGINGIVARFWQMLLLNSDNSIYSWLPMDEVLYQNKDEYFEHIALANSKNIDESKEKSISIEIDEATNIAFIEFMLSIILQACEQLLADEITHEDDNGKQSAVILKVYNNLSDIVEVLTDKNKINQQINDKLDEVNHLLSYNEQMIYRQVAQYLYEHEQISNKEVVALIDKSSATARRYLAKLVDCGLLTAMGENKARIYQLI